MDLSPEGKHIEYKEAKRALPKDFWETYSSFANTEGGIIILGITDNLQIQGVIEPTKILKELFTNINNTKKLNINIISDNDI